jgi:3-deoxy-manno-octulosonate cytidylyltransferase (CMP-KDO synthetase)
MTTAILIPARFDSSRLPGKMLADMCGMPLIHYVYKKCADTGLDTYVLTDSEKIASALPIPSKNIIHTKRSHENGTSRCMEVIDSVLNYDKYVNVQGDMPDITGDIIKAVEHKLDVYDVSTAYTQMNAQHRNDPNVVKMIHNNSCAHWFLRASLEYGDRHLGIYGYTRFAKKMYEVTEKFIEEDIEKLEQLRWIQNNIKIGVTPVAFNGIEINTPEDLELWKTTNCH